MITVEIEALVKVTVEGKAIDRNHVETRLDDNPNYEEGTNGILCDGGDLIVCATRKHPTGSLGNAIGVSIIDIEEAAGPGVKVFEVRGKVTA